MLPPFARSYGTLEALAPDRSPVSRIAVVTGASSGIGAETARLLSRRGWHCVLLARREDRLQALAEEVGGEYEVCDVADRDAVERAASRILERHPRVHLLVCNAGIPARTTFLEGDVDVVMRTNYLGGIWCLRAFLPGLEAAALEAEAPSHVVNVVSVAGVVAFPPSGPYSASKHAQLAFSRATAAQLRGRGIQVHTVKPGFVETEGFPQDRLPRPARRLVIEPPEVARHILRAVERDRVETTVPWFYAPLGVVQALMPSVLSRVLAGSGHRSRIKRR